MSWDPLEHLCKESRVLAYIVCDPYGTIVSVKHLSRKLGVTLNEGISIESVHPVFVGTIEALRSSNLWTVPLLEWSPDLYVALQMERSAGLVAAQLFDFSEEARALRGVQQRINNLRLSPPPGFDATNLPQEFTEEITTSLELFFKDQARVFAALERIERSPPPQPTPVRKKQVGRILHADDDLMVSVLVRAVIEELTGEYKWVGNGKDAVDAFTREYYDCVILDYNMPLLDGVQAAKEIVRRCHEIHHRKTPVLILLSSKVGVDLDLESTKDVFDHVVSKADCMSLEDIISGIAEKSGT
jgi:CheY-like chemotaxis protein